MPRKPKITYEPGSMVVCLESNVGPDGDTIRQGDRIRASHPQVLRNPQLFHVEGLTTKEVHELRQARFYSPGGEGAA